MPCETAVKKLIKKNRFPEAFAGKYSFSPYMGCGHDCKYCDGRCEKYHFSGELHKDITVRINTSELLAQELPKLREFGPICISSGISDAYQPIESNYRIMEQCSATLAEYSFPVIIHTKSAMILRDWSHWQKVNQQGGMNLYVSLTWLDDNMSAKFEPHASPASQRINILKQAVDSGFSTGILAMPLIPEISDNTLHIRKLLQLARDIGVDFIWISSLTLKPGRQKNYFMDFIKEEFPEALPAMERLYNNNDKYGTPAHNRQFHNSLLPLYREYGYIDGIPHQVYHRKFAIYDEINILLHDLHKYYRHNPNSPSRDSLQRLKSSTKLYREWLMGKKKYLAHRHNLSYKQIDNEILHLLTENRFSDIIHNTKLQRFLQKVFLDGSIFDYFYLRMVE